MSAARILIADDDPFIRDLLRQRLTQMGYQIVLARDGVEAVDRALETRPSLIVLDTVMPERNGLETLQHLKQDPQLAPIPVVMLTALRARGDVLSALRLGAADYVAKPFQVDHLCRRIRAVFETVLLRSEHVLI